MQFGSTNLKASLNCLSKSDGSAELSISRYFVEFFYFFLFFIKLKRNKKDETCQMCAVYGPGEVKIMKELVDRASVSITYKSRIYPGSGNNREKVIEYTICSICDGAILTHLHPRTAINIIVQEIQNDGNVKIFLKIKVKKKLFYFILLKSCWRVL
jgi:hypothetical protein